MYLPLSLCLKIFCYLIKICNYILISTGTKGIKNLLYNQIEYMSKALNLALFTLKSHRTVAFWDLRDVIARRAGTAKTTNPVTSVSQTCT